MIVAEQELYRACEVLFDLDLDRISRDFLEYIQLSGIKTAYRQKARETHPDMHITESEFVRRRNTDMFLHVQQSYEKLCTYLNARESGFRFPVQNQRPVPTPSWQSRPAANRSAKPARKHHGKKPPANAKPNGFDTHGARPRMRDGAQFEKLYSGSIPSRKLLLGHFLYYSGVITWREIVQALVWQRTHRPRLGEIASRFGWLSPEDIQRILTSRNLSRPFGMSAIDLGLLNETQLKAMILHQQRLQKRIGSFFIEHNILTPDDMNRLIGLYNQHNIRQAMSSFRAE